MRQNLSIDRAGRAEIVLRQGLLGGFERLLDRRCSGSGLATPKLQQPLHEDLDLTLRKGADEPVDRPALEKGVDRRDGLDAHLPGQIRVLVDIDLDHANGAFGLAHSLLQKRAELLACAAQGARRAAAAARGGGAGPSPRCSRRRQRIGAGRNFDQGSR